MSELCIPMLSMRPCMVGIQNTQMNLEERTKLSTLSTLAFPHGFALSESRQARVVSSSVCDKTRTSEASWLADGDEFQEQILKELSLGSFRTGLRCSYLAKELKRCVCGSIWRESRASRGS